MTVAVAQRTLGHTVVAIAQLTGDWQNQGVSTAGSTTTLTDDGNERTPVAASNLNTGKFLYGFSGTGAGLAKEVTTYGTIGVFTWTGASTNPGTDTGWVLLKRRPQLILDEIDRVTRLHARKQALPFLSESIVTNSLLHCYGAMEEWAGGASAAPDGWTLGGAGAAVARESTTIAQGLYSAAITAGAGAVGTLTRTLPTELIRRLDNASLTLYGLMANTTAADAVVRVTTTTGAGTAANTDRTSTYASNRWEELDDISDTAISVPDEVISIAVQLRAVASAVCYFDDIALIGPDIRDYDLPATLIGLEKTIWMESGWRTRKFDTGLFYGVDWVLVRRDGTTARTLHFLRKLPSARHLRINGFRAPAIVSTTTSNVEPNPEWLAKRVAMNLLEQSSFFSEEVQRRLANLQKSVAELENSVDGNTTWGKAGKIAWIESR